MFANLHFNTTIFTPKKLLKEKNFQVKTNLLQKILQIIQWLPIQMRVFHSNENGLFSTQPPSVAPLFLVEGKRQAGSSHLDGKFSFE